MTQEQFYHSMTWKRVRKAYIDYRISIDGGMCEVCGDVPGKVVHHKQWLNDNNVNDLDVSVSFDNLRYECQTCHNREVEPGKQTPGRVRFDADGNIIFGDDAPYSER